MGCSCSQMEAVVAWQLHSSFGILLETSTVSAATTLQGMQADCTGALRMVHLRKHILLHKKSSGFDGSSPSGHTGARGHFIRIQSFVSVSTF